MKRSRIHMTRPVALLSLTFLLALPSPSGAGEPRAPEVLAVENDRALGVAEQGKFEDAISIWRDILDEASGKMLTDVHVNLAVAYKALDRLPEAWYHLDAAIQSSTTPDPAVEAERAAVDQALAKTHVPLRFSCDTPGTEIFFTAERTVGYPCPLRWWFKRGTEENVWADAPDYKTGEIPIRAHELDRDRLVMVALVPVPPTVIPEKPVAVPLVVEKPPARDGGQAWKWSLFGGGMGLVAVGAILQVVAFDKDQQLRKDYPGDVTDITVWQANRKSYQDGFNNDVKPMVYGAYAMYGIGGAAAATGLTFLIADWSKPSTPEVVRVRPLVVPDVLGMTIDLDF